MKEKKGNKNIRENSHDTGNPLLSTRGEELTLCMIFDDHKNPSRILLGLKKQGFGIGNWNGFGGHPEPGETLEEATIREVKEECNIDVHDLEHKGILTFHMEDDPTITRVHVFIAKEWSGEPVGSEEMTPEWYDIKDIPYDKMWEDDRHWLPRVIRGQSADSNFFFDKNNNLLRHEINGDGP